MTFRCSPEAYAKCPDRTLCGKREDATFTEGSECDIFNRSVEARSVTVLDKLRTMFEKDAAGFLYNLAQLSDISSLYCKPKQECLELVDGEIPPEWCKNCLMEYLEMPASEVMK